LGTFLFFDTKKNLAVLSVGPKISEKPPIPPKKYRENNLRYNRIFFVEKINIFFHQLLHIIVLKTLKVQES